MKREDFALVALRDLPPELADHAALVLGLLPGHHAQSEAARSLVAEHRAHGKWAVMRLLVKLATEEVVRLDELLYGLETRSRMERRRRRLANHK